ncbi:MAG: CaiB/BaiF CoA transferase family protein [Gammaproteobacteria bacterium]
MTENFGPIAGIRVLDMTRVVAGPFAGQMLGDLGADVVKIERPVDGDDSRHVGPPWMLDADGRQSAESTYFQAVNRNKRSVTINFADPAGADLIRRLAAQSDVLLENYRTGTLAAYGLGYEDLKKINPRLIYCSLTGFGQTGPYSDRSGYDYLVQAMAGLMNVTGHHPGDPGAGPMRVGVAIADIVAGMFLAMAVLAALNRRHETGQGQAIDVALFDSQLATMLNHHAAWFNSRVDIGPTGNDHPSAVPYGVFDVDDGHILIATFNDREFARVANVVGHPEWIDDPRFAKNPGRVANRRLICSLINEALKGGTKAQWVERFNAAKVSCGPINRMPDLERDEQVLGRGLVIEQPHPINGRVRTAANPMRFSESPVRYRHPPPMRGQHTDDVLGDLLGLDAAARAVVRGRGIVE